MSFPWKSEYSSFHRNDLFSVRKLKLLLSERAITLVSIVHEEDRHAQVAVIVFVLFLAFVQTMAITLKRFLAELVDGS